MKKKVIIIDDHRIIRDGLKAIFRKNKSYEVIADFDNGDELFEFIKDHPADIILMDIHLATTNGIEITRMVKQAYPEIKVIMHTMSDDPHNIAEARAIGAEGYVFKSAGQMDLEKAMEIVASGGISFPS